jgi:hypothetical protein
MGCTYNEAVVGLLSLLANLLRTEKVKGNKWNIETVMDMKLYFITIVI